MSLNPATVALLKNKSRQTITSLLEQHNLEPTEANVERMTGLWLNALRQTYPSLYVGLGVALASRDVAGRRQLKSITRSVLRDQASRSSGGKR